MSDKVETIKKRKEESHERKTICKHFSNTKKQQKVLEAVTVIMSDGNEHTVAELQEQVIASGIRLSKGSSLVRSVVSSMTNDAILTRTERGVYQLSSMTNSNKSTDKNDPFITLYPNKKQRSQFAVNILENGHINLNKKLNSVINSRNIKIQFTPNYRQIRLVCCDEESHSFTKAGTAINTEICSSLRQHRIGLPARYIITYNQKDNTYVGNLEQTK